MDTPTKMHPGTETIQSFALGQLDELSADVVRLHLEQCEDCRRKGVEITADSFLNGVRRAQAVGSVDVDLQPIRCRR